MRFTLMPWSLGQKHSFNLSQLPGEYTARGAVALRAEGLFKHNINLYPRRYPFIPLGEEKQL